jgi:hypothetical protein
LSIASIATSAANHTIDMMLSGRASCIIDSATPESVVCGVCADGAAA